MIAENTHCSITMQHIASLTCTGVLCPTQTGRPPHTKHRISSLRNNVQQASHKGSNALATKPVTATPMLTRFKFLELQNAHTQHPSSSQQIAATYSACTASAAAADT